MPEIITLSDGDTALADIELGKKMIAALETHYPNHSWYVTANHKAGWLTIQLLYKDMSGVARLWKFGMGVAVKNLLNDHEISQRAMRDGGELLERYGLARAAAKEDVRFLAAERKIHTENMVR